jgi:hypothetical protein
MKRDYLVYPSMIGSEGGIIWSYDNVQVTSTFDDTHPLDVTAAKCNDLSICLWYVSPLWQFADSSRTKYALLGEQNKWTAVSQQRFTSIVTNTEKTQTTITLQGAAAESVQLGIYHHALSSSVITCQIPAGGGQARVVITPSNVVCA